MRTLLLSVVMFGVSLCATPAVQAQFFNRQDLENHGPCPHRPGTALSDWAALGYPLITAQTIEDCVARCVLWEKTCLRVVDISQACWLASIDQLLRLADAECDTLPSPDKKSCRIQNREAARETRRDVIHSVSAGDDCFAFREQCLQECQDLIGPIE